MGVNNGFDERAMGLMQMLADVAALREDSVAQRQMLVDGLQKIFATKIGWLLVADNCRVGLKVVIRHQVLTSNCSPDWARYIGEFAIKYPIEADVCGYHSQRCNADLSILKWRELLPDKAAEQKYAVSDSGSHPHRGIGKKNRA